MEERKRGKGSLTRSLFFSGFDDDFCEVNKSCKTLTVNQCMNTEDSDGDAESVKLSSAHSLMVPLLTIALSLLFWL